MGTREQRQGTFPVSTTRVRWIYILLETTWLLVGGLGLSSSDAQQREMVLTLREATAFALQGNLDIQIAGLTPTIRAAQLDERKGIFDVTARASLRASSSRLLDTSTTFLETTEQGKISKDNSQEQRFAVGISQLTPYGGTYDVELSETHLDTTRRTSGNRSDPRPLRNEYYTEDATLRIIQPLLRNFGSTVTKSQILIAQNNVSSSREEFRQQVIVITSRVQQAYWDLVFRRQDLEVRRQQKALAQRLLDQIRRQVAVGTLAPLEVVQAETNIARADERIIIAENALYTAEDRLKRVMNFSLTGEKADVLIVPADAPEYHPVTLQQEEQIRQALEYRTDLIQAKLALENQHITLIFDSNQTLPMLDLEASFRFNGVDQSFDSSIRAADPSTRNRWEVGLNFRYPLNNRQAKSREQQSRLGIRQQLIRIKNLEENVTVDVRAAVRDVITNGQRVQASRVASRLAQKQLEAEEKKLQVGLATVFTVLQFQDVLSVERSNEINALAEYVKSLVRLEEVKNSLLQSYNIVLQSDGPRLQ